MNEHNNAIDRHLLALAETRIVEAQREFPCSLCSKCQWQSCHLAGAYRAPESLLWQIKGADHETAHEDRLIGVAIISLIPAIAAAAAGWQTLIGFAIGAFTILLASIIAGEK